MHENNRVENLPFLGRSWYRRGASYWIRRAMITGMLLVALAVMTVMTGGLVEGIATANMPLWVRVVILIIIAAAVVRSMFKAWSAFSITNRARKRGIALSMAEVVGEPHRSARKRQRRAVAWGAGFAPLAMLGGGALLAVSVVFNFGWGIILVIASCQKYFSPEEFAAWQKINRKRSQA